MQGHALSVLQSGELGQVVELVHHLRLGLGERQRVVRGELVHKEDSSKDNLYISSQRSSYKGTF